MVVMEIIVLNICIGIFILSCLVSLVSPIIFGLIKRNRERKNIRNMFKEVTDARNFLNNNFNNLMKNAKI